MDGGAKMKNLEDILTEKQINCIISQNSKSGSKLLSYDLRSATEGLAGFLGDHFKVTLHIGEGDVVKKLYLFVKTVPSVNAPKAQFINENSFFQRESLTFGIFENYADEEFSDSSPWGVKALIHNHNILVLPDLSVEGYKTYPAIQYLDLEHVQVTLKSLARFHAAFAKYQTQVFKVSGNNKLHENFACFLKDPQFCDCPWLHAGIKTTTRVLKEFSSKIKQYPPNLEELVTKWCIDACDGLRDYGDTLNVIIHKDLWANNVLFKYSGAKPVNAILIDFQCARYAPPAIDVLVFLYYNTSRTFRERYERELLDQYYTVFSESIDESTRCRLDKLNYNREAFAHLCEKLRPAGMIVPLEICPFIVMSSDAAKEAFDDPNTFEKHFFKDRCDLVLNYARENEYYKTRVLEVFEDFVETHLVRPVT